MKKESLKFSIHNLILGDGVPGKELFAGLKESYKFPNQMGLSGTVDVENTEHFLWVFSRSGRSMPYAADVMNTRTSDLEENPRKQDQAELRNQGFCLYDYESNQLFTSGGLDFFKRILSEVNSEIRVRNVYKSRKEFLERLRKVSKLRFVAQEDIFTWQDTLFSKPRDLLGLDCPEQMKVEFKFPYADVTEHFLGFVKNFGIPGCDQGSLKSLVVVGRSEEGDRLVESTFNLKNLESSITIDVMASDTGMYDPGEVKSVLVTHLGW